jgi:hypothetical protein
METGEDAYYRLDNSAVFMAAIANAAGPFVYRLSCTFTEIVRLPELQAALEALYPRFPFLFVALRRGVFWHYLDPIPKPPKVEKEAPTGCRRIPYRPGQPLVRIVAFGPRIACEFHHVVTDGFGASTFVRALAAEYLRRLGYGAEMAEESFAGLPRPGEAVGEGEDEDSYARYFRSRATVPDRTPKAFLIPGARTLMDYRETIGFINLESILAAAKGKQATVTEFLAAIHIAVLQDLYEAQTPAKRRWSRTAISVQVPVNLRKIYPSKTLRNFFLFAAPSIDVRLGHWDFDEILRRVHHQLRLGMEEKELVRQLKRNVGAEKKIISRPIFLPVKNILLRIINLLIGVGAYSGSLSNLGAFMVPSPLEDHIRCFSLLPSRAFSTGTNVGVLSWKNELIITFGSQLKDRSFERLFFSRLASFGLGASVVSSQAWDGGS